MLTVACHFRGKECFVDNVAFCFMIQACYVQQDVCRDVSCEGVTRALPRFVIAAGICLSLDSYPHFTFLRRGSVQSSRDLYILL